jgi:hypothetical protein
MAVAEGKLLFRQFRWGPEKIHDNYRSLQSNFITSSELYIFLIPVTSVTSSSHIDYSDDDNQKTEQRIT